MLKRVLLLCVAFTCIYTDGNIIIMIAIRFWTRTLIPALIRIGCAALIDEFDYFNLPGLSVGVKL